jgi:hypothetical protein
MYEVKPIIGDHPGDCVGYRVVRTHGRSKRETAGTFSGDLRIAREQALALALALNAIEVGYDRAYAEMKRHEPEI